MTDDDLDLEARLRRYQAPSLAPQVWRRIETRTTRRELRMRAAQWAAILLLATTVLLRFATVRVERSLVPAGDGAPIDIEALAVNMGQTQ